MSRILKINNSKFKSIYISYNFTMKLEKEEIAKNVISCFTLSKISNKFENSKEIEKYLSSMYGANFDINVEKVGDLFNFEFRVNCLNKKYTKNNEDVLYKCLEFLNEIIYNPKIFNGKFDENTFVREKEYVVSNIMKRKDEKIKYAVSRVEELIYPDSSCGSFIYGSEESAKNVSNEDCYRAYENMIKNSDIFIILSGNLDGYDNLDENLREIFSKNIEFDKDNFKYTKEDVNTSNVNVQEKEVIEKMDTNQAVICLAIENKQKKDDDFIIANVYNEILGGSPSSKLFQNVREKESLAYTARSRFYRLKKLHVIYAGINQNNYERAKTVILNQISDMENGNITYEELDSAKKSLISDLKEWNDSKVALCKHSYLNKLMENDIKIEQMINKIESVNVDDIIKYAKNNEVVLLYMLGGEDNEK